MINFLEIFNITFAIYADNVQYNLVKVQADDVSSQSCANLASYRVFSQMKDESKIELLPEAYL